MRNATCLLLLLAVSLLPYERARGETFAELSAAYLDEFPQLAPVAATQLGDHRFDGQLDQVSAAACDRKRQLALAYIKRLDDLQQDQLTADQRIDFELLQHELVVHDHSGHGDGFRFNHALVQDAVYGSLLSTDRKALHHAIAVQLEHRYGRNDFEVVEEIARHYRGSDDLPRSWLGMMKASLHKLCPCSTLTEWFPSTGPVSIRHQPEGDLR